MRVALWICLALATDGIEGRAELPIEGDRQALQLVQDVQTANLTAFPRGHARFRTEFVRGDFGKGERIGQRHEVREGEVLWDGVNSYWDYVESHEVRPGGAGPATGQATLAIRAIYGPRFRYGHAYLSTPSRASRQVGELPPTDKTLGVIPMEAWYSERAPYIDETWASRLDPARNQKRAEKFLIERPDDDQIVVRSVLRSAPPITITCSLAAGGNVIRTDQPYKHDAPPNRARYGETNVYDWVAVGDGRFRLKTVLRTTGPPGEVPDSSFSLEILEFDPAPKIPKDRFSFDSLRVPDGTILVDIRNGKRSESIVGNARAEVIDEEVLRKLGAQAREKGFGESKP